MTMIDIGQWASAKEPIARKAFFEGMREVPAERDTLFRVRPSNKLTETYFEDGDVGALEDFNGELAYDSIEQGNTMTITATEKAKGIKITRKFTLTDQQNVVDELPRKLGLGTRRRIASDVFYGFNNAFSGVVTTMDGLALCHSAHTSPHEDGSNQSNKGSTAYSAVALSASRVSMRKFLTTRDNKFEVQPDLIVCGVDLEEAVWESINSMGKVDTALNNKNFHEGRYKMISSPWLDDTNDWFLIDSELMKQWAVWNEVEKPDFKKADEFDSFAAKFAVYTMYGFGFLNWRWVFGSQVA